MNTGWYIVYILMIFLNQLLCTVNGYPIDTWQNWAYSAMLILCFVSGAEYRKGE